MSEKDLDSPEQADVSDGRVVETSATGSHAYLKSRHLYMIAIGGKRRPVPSRCRDARHGQQPPSNSVANG